MAKKTKNSKFVKKAAKVAKKAAKKAEKSETKVDRSNTPPDSPFLPRSPNDETMSGPVHDHTGALAGLLIWYYRSACDR